MEAGIIEVDMFSRDVNSEDHPEVITFKEILMEVAEEYNCELLHFEINQGTVAFSFDSDELMADILKILQNKESNEGA
jgi:hypothetical protein